MTGRRWPACLAAAGYASTFFVPSFSGVLPESSAAEAL